MNLTITLIPQIALTLIALLGTFATANAQSESKKLKDIYIRDPFIVTDHVNKTYYLYRSSDSITADDKRWGGVEMFKSKDLENWIGPKVVCRLPQRNWTTGSIWAPEVHQYNGKYYLFATLNSNLQWKAPKDGWPAYILRGTQIFHSDSPEGPFVAFNDVPHTPLTQMALDGTLWVEGNTPYMVYCQEWVQTVDGLMNLVQLAPDLSEPVGEPTTLFASSDAEWSDGLGGNHRDYITDGCFLYRTKIGKLLMIWSSFHKGQYAIGIAESTTGRIAGPWKQQKDMLFSQDGGHGMIFRKFDGTPCIILHTSNGVNGAERAAIFPLIDKGTTLRLKK